MCMESVSVVLSVLLMGLIPVSQGPAAKDFAADQLPLAPLAVTVDQPFPSHALAQALSASGAAIVDMQSGQRIFGRNAAERRPVGSLTKIMTALLIAESHRMNEVVTIPKDIARVSGSKVYLPLGNRFTVGDLLSALLVSSANDAAETLARFHSGSVKSFVRLMNERARVLGLKGTSFANPSGLDDNDQWSTASDVAWLAAYAFRQPEIRKRMSMASTTIRSREGETVQLEHTHALLGRGGPVVAGKTGTTSAAKECLLSIVEGHGREYIVVLLGSRERYVDMRIVLRILNSFFA